MRAARLKQLLFRILVVMLIAGTLQGLGLGSSPVSASAAYTVTYDGNGNDGGSVPVDITSYEPGDLAIVHDNSNGLTKKGFIFGGWNTAADGSGTDYIPGQTFQMGTANVTLYAKWINPTSTWTNLFSFTSNFNDVAYNNGVFSAVGNSGLIASSGDGNIWTKQTGGTTKDLHGITGGDGKFVAVGADGTILISKNGADWFYRSSGTANTLRGVTYGDGLFLAVGDNGTIVTSGNGSYWTSVSSGTTNQLNDGVYANGQFIVVGSMGTILTSTDGQEWSVKTDVALFDLLGIAAGNGKIVAVGVFGTVLTSSDGANWISETSGVFSNLHDIEFGNDRFVSVGTFGDIIYSPDGDTWSSVSNGTSTQNGIAYGNGLFVAVGNSGIVLSTDGVAWTTYQAPSDYLYGITYGNGLFITVGASGVIYSSENGAVWKKHTSNTASTLRSVAYGNGLYVAVGDGGTILTSSNGADWTVHSSPTTNKLNGVTYGNNKFVAVGASGTFVYSSDGVDWSSTTVGTYDVNAVVYATNKFIAVGGYLSGSSVVYSSIDGEQWGGSSISPKVKANTIAVGDNLLVAAGEGFGAANYRKNVITSASGSSSWTQQTSGLSGPVPINGVAYGNGNYVYAAFFSNIGISKDGTNWTLPTLSGVSNNLFAVASGDRQFVVVGSSGVILQSLREAPAHFTIHFDENGGDTKVEPAFMMLMPGDKLGALPTPPRRTGYSFAGWNTEPDGSGTALDESFVLEADTVAYAQWHLLPAAPANLTSTDGDSEVALSWDAVTGADSYAVYRHEGEAAPADPGDWVLAQANVTENAYTVTGLTNGTTYAFAVRSSNETGTSDYSEAVVGVPGGNGTAEHPYLVTDAEKLNQVRNNLNAYYVLVNDIDLSGFDNWHPIGVSMFVAAPFNGHFDGKGHTISGLTATDNDSGYVGLFGDIGSGGVVQNLVLSDVDISTSNIYSNAGALAGTLEGSAVNVRVTGGTVAGKDKVGGLVGATSSGAYIHASCANVQVVGAWMLAYTGGLAGQLEGAEISESCSAGEVSGGWFAGGMVGIIIDSRIINSYATGSVTGPDAVGGLIGGLGSYMEGETPPSALTNVYAAGKVSGTPGTDLGGLIGRKYDEIHLNSAYYDKDKTGQSDEQTYSGTPLTHDEMGKEDSFVDWDFDTIWHLDDRIGLPAFLRDDNTAPVMSGAKIANETPNQVSVYFPEKIEADDAALDRFTVSVNGSDAQITDKQLNGKELILTLGEPVLNGQEVAVAYTDGAPAITDKAQNRMVTGTIEADNEAEPHIKIVSFAPVDNATEVAVDEKLILTFNDSVEAIPGKYIYLMTEGGAIAEKIEANAPNVQVADQVVTITPSESLLPLKGYYVLIDAGAFRHAEFDVHGGIADPAAWNFMTAPDPEAKWVSVGEGFTEGNASFPVLKAGADGTLYVLFGDKQHGGKATVMKLGKNGAQWSLVGSAGFSPGAIGVPSLLVDGDVLYAAFGVVNDSVHVMKYELDGEGDWTPAGEPIDAGEDPDSDPFLLMHNGAVHIAYRDGIEDGKMTVKRLNAGGDWETIGDAGFSADEIYYPSLAVLDGTLYAGFTDYVFDAGFGATVMKFNTMSGKWEPLGNRGFTSDFAFDTSLVSDGDRLYVIYENGGYRASAMLYDAVKGEWVKAGGGFSSGQVYEIAVAAEDGGLYAAYRDVARNDRMTVKKYTGSGWVEVGSSGFTPGKAYDPSLIVHDGVPYVVFEDRSSPGKLSAMKYRAFTEAPGAPNVTADDELNVIVGADATMEYSKDDGKSYTPYHPSNPPTFDGDVTVKVRVASDEATGTPAGADTKLTFTANNSTISPTTADFDKYAGSAGYVDVTTTLTLNGNTLTSIKNGAALLVPGMNYTESENTVTIKREYLESQQTGAMTLTFTFSDGGTQTLTVTISDSTPIDAEAPVLQSVEAGNAQVALTWSPIIGATGYKVFASVTSSTYGTEVTTVGGSVYSYTVTGLTNGVTYYFAVKSVKSGIDSDASNVLGATPFTVPSAPTNVSAFAGNGQATVTFTAPSDNGGREITGYEVTVTPGGKVVSGTASPIVITGLINGTRYTFTVRAINNAGSSEPSAPSNLVVPSTPSSEGDDDDDDAPSKPDSSTEPETTEPETIDNSVTVLVNGKEEKAGTASTSTRNNQTVTTIAIDPAKLDEKLAEEGQNTIVTIPVPSGADVAVGELNGQMVKNMEDYQAVLEIKTDRATYTLPAQQININAISEQIGASVALQDIKVQIEIGEPAADTAKLVENAAAGGTFTLVVPPVEFIVRATYGETTVEVSKFDVYIERTIAIPDGFDPNKITTGVAIDADGTVRHVPTKIIAADGKYYAVINSLTNSTYTVVWRPIEFSDVAAHWAKDTVNNMGSRMIIEGTGGGQFSPDRDITRAEFVAIIVRALGLRLDEGTSVFPDVNESDWYNSAIRTAYAYGLLSGFADGAFRPNDKITREQAMVIISKVMAITGLNAKLPGYSADATLRSYADAAQASGWAISSIADCVQAGIVSGRNGNKLAPLDSITRAEAAAMVERLLLNSDLI